jgi:maltose-binding protein MalE
MVPEAPQSFADLIDQAIAWTKDDDQDGRNETYGLVFNQKEPFWLVPFLGGFGGWVVDDRNQPSLGGEAMVQALAFLHVLKYEHKVMPREADYEVADALFKEGKAAFIINGPWSWQQYLDAGIDLGLAPIPPLAGGGWPSPMVSAKGYSLNANARGEKRELALQLLDYLTSEEIQTEKAAAMGMIPSRKSAASKAGELHPLVGPSRAQIERGRAMPVIPEMRAIWDVLRPAFQEVMGDRLTPVEAADQMQEKVVKKIEEMGGN